MDRGQSYIRVSELELRREQAIEKCGEGLRQPSMFEAANIASFVSWEDIVGNAENLQLRLEAIASATSLADLMEAKEQHFYFEAQIHDRVTIEDIAEIIYIEDIPSGLISIFTKRKVNCGFCLL
ncbi:hypothetical protein [Argonema galeatum]|uniref:hypothetical protein n=1 Tax=Argonema galeatum TaxID=2942762 RepID=UPI002011922D|nr:hypothetical protein [Argonema galeatum]MCL1468012.1 hypothetical protein [Argonema galeatum A003/A1]